MEDILRKCPKCKIDKPFFYIGRQSGFGEPDFDLYNCRTCNGTFANETLGIELLTAEELKSTPKRAR